MNCHKIALGKFRSHSSVLYVLLEITCYVHNVAFPESFGVGEKFVVEALCTEHGKEGSVVRGIADFEGGIAIFGINAVGTHHDTLHNIGLISGFAIFKGVNDFQSLCYGDGTGKSDDGAAGGNLRGNHLVLDILLEYALHDYDVTCLNLILCSEICSVDVLAAENGDGFFIRTVVGNRISCILVGEVYLADIGDDTLHINLGGSLAAVCKGIDDFQGLSYGVRLFGGAVGLVGKLLEGEDKVCCTVGLDGKDGLAILGNLVGGELNLYGTALGAGLGEGSEPGSVAGNGPCAGEVGSGDVKAGLGLGCCNGNLSRETR